MPGWFDEQGITGYEPVQQPQGRPGAELGGPTPQQQGPPQQRQPFNFEAFQQRAQELSAGASGTNAEFQQRIFPQLAQEFGGLERFGSKGDKIRLPNGQVIDAVISAGLGGKGYNWGIEGPARPKAMPMMSLGNIGQTPMTSTAHAPMQMSGMDTNTAPGADLSQFAAPQPAPMAVAAPQTVQGPDPMKLQGIPGFANGVLDFKGGPAIVGERGPELLNLPQGSDVIPMEAGASLPATGELNFGNGGQLPAVGGGSMTLGGGGGLPAIGQAQTPLTLGGGGGLPTIGQIGGQAAPQPQAGPQSNGAYQYNPMAAPQNYTPQNVQGPDRLTLGSIGRPGAISANQVGPGQQVQAGTAMTGGYVSPERIGASTIGAPERVGAERVQGPQALNAERLSDPGQFRNLSLAEFQQDPSYQFDRGEQLGAIENSAAAKGMLHHPNTIRGLQETASNLANRQYDTVNARNLGVQQQNFQNQSTLAGQNNAATAQAYGLTNQFQQQAALANQSTGLQAALANQSTGLQANMFNAGQTQNAAQFNAGNALQSGMFNSGQQQQVNLANIGNQLQAGQFNSAQGQQAALANQGANLQAGQFNAGMDFQTQQANLQNQLAAYNAYQPLAQQNQQFNAAQNAAANQNNFANQFSVNQANNAGNLGAFNANLGAEMGRGQLALGNRQADQSYDINQGQLALGNRSADQSYDLGLRNNALGNRTADQNYGIALGNLGINQGQLDLQGQNQAYNQDANTFNTNYGIFRDNRDTAFNQDLARTQIGAGAAGNYGNQAGGYYVNQGAANGNAGMAGAGAWAGALGQIGNAAGQYYYGGGQPTRTGYVDPEAPTGAIPWNGRG